MHELIFEASNLLSIGVCVLAPENQKFMQLVQSVGTASCIRWNVPTFYSCRCHTLEALIHKNCC